MIFKKRVLFGPNPSVPWASKMVLNPAMTADPRTPGVIHMLFRATGPGEQYRVPGKPLPYPICLGYAVSRDEGQTWLCDWSRPALMPSLKQSLEDLMTVDVFGRSMVNYANGCIEDPRLFLFEDELYLTIACRAFPPGPYWDHDDPVQCMPEEIRARAQQLGTAVAENGTVTLLYKVDLAALAVRDYDRAFSFVTPLHQPDVSDDRDVVLFPRRLEIGGRRKIACLHRPKYPWRYEQGKAEKTPVIFLALADSMADFYAGTAEEYLFAGARFPWEANRIGTSFAPVELSPGEWLLPYHGKQDDTVGYTQSFMLFRENGRTIPDIVARPSERLLFASEPWELEGNFTIPCLFSCSGVQTGDGRLLMGYGAADAKVGLASCDFTELVDYLRK